MKNWRRILNTPAWAVTMVSMLVLVGELLIMLLIGALQPIFKSMGPIFWEFIDPITLIAITSPALYVLIFRPMRNQQVELEGQLDVLRYNKQLGALIGAIPDAVFLKDGAGRWLIINESAKQLFQLHNLLWQGKTEMELADMHPAFRAAHEECRTSDEQAWQSGQLLVGEERMAGEDGRCAIIETRKMPMFGKDGRREGLAIIARDITARKALEAAQQDVARHLQRITDFSVLLSSANEAIAQMENEADMLRSLCELAVHHAHLRLAWIGQPDSDGWFQMLAAAGPMGYLAGIRISASAELPEGQGPAGQSWRDQKPVYNASFTKNPRMKPWAQRAETFGIKAGAALPIFRGGKQWAVLAVGHGEENIFDADLQKILTDLAQDVGYGLDRLDILKRERETNVFNEVLLNSQSSGIGVVHFPERVLERVNTRMLEMLVASSPEDLVGQPVRRLYPDEETYDRVDAVEQKPIQRSRTPHFNAAPDMLI